ncbi:MAG: Hpt domain-containing protein [Clostridia bacterium]|nr:Hpt domain-containing protein [Clostridia bacterium]
MNEQQRHALSLRETDLSGVMKRFYGDEELYVSCLDRFLYDPTMAELNTAIKNQAWDEAFTAAHAMKGLAGNMGFIPLMHATGQLVVLIRGGRTREIGGCMAQVNSSYRDITDAIRQNFMQTGEEKES